MAFNLEDYFKTTFENKLLVKMPEREDDHLTPATRLLEKRREMSEVEQALIAQKEEFQMKMESLQQRREELENKERQLKESLLKFDKFLKENDSKRARAIKKASDERELTRGKERDIQRLKQDIEDLAETKNDLQKKLTEHTLYQKFLEKVLESGDDYNEIRDVILRYDTLSATHEDLLKKQQDDQDGVEDKRQMLVKYMEEKHNEILSYNNQLANLQSELDKAHSLADKWESKWMRIKNTAAKKTLSLGRIKMATHNLYLLVKKHQQQTPTTEDTHEQLSQIAAYVHDLGDVVADLLKINPPSTPAAFND